MWAGEWRLDSALLANQSSSAYIFIPQGDNVKDIDDVNTRLILDSDTRNFNFEKTQHISSDFMDSLKAQRENSMGLLEGEMMSVARVPAIVYEKWLKEGFDIMKEPAHAIVARLKQENLDGFLTTKKKV